MTEQKGTNAVATMVRNDSAAPNMATVVLRDRIGTVLPALAGAVRSG